MYAYGIILREIPFTSHRQSSLVHPFWFRDAFNNEPRTVEHVLKAFASFGVVMHSSLPSVEIIHLNLKNVTPHIHQNLWWGRTINSGRMTKFNEGNYLVIPNKCK